jgi:RNA recognition motif-containing protein
MIQLLSRCYQTKKQTNCNCNLQLAPHFSVMHISVISPSQKKARMSSSRDSSDSDSSSFSDSMTEKLRRSRHKRRKRIRLNPSSSTSAEQKEPVRETREKRKELPSSLQQEHPQKEMDKRILLKGLTTRVTREHLREILSEYGQVKHIVDYGKGDFVVKFENSNQCEMCLEYFDNALVDNKRIHLSWLHNKQKRK